MIIGVSGKIESGKDTVGRIIYALMDETYDGTNESLFPLEAEGSFSNNWQIKKFAGKLKQIVCLITGCTMEQLEDSEFKNSPLPVKWQIPNELGDVITITYRDLLQRLGTEIGRQINPNAWVNALFADYKCLDHTIDNTDKYYDHSNCAFPNWVITDVRFPNEMQAIKDRGGIVIRVNRNLTIGGSDYGYTKISVNKAEKDEIIKPQHISETALDDEEFDYVINNDGTIEELIEKVKIMLQEFNISIN